jgi:hypothetical protein
MDHPIGEVLKREFSATGSKVAVSVEITLDVSVN